MTNPLPPKLRRAAAAIDAITERLERKVDALAARLRPVITSDDRQRARELLESGPGAFGR